MAAGLGFKTFTTGEVLTAADTNGYLMQGVLVFASSAARAAAITSPQEGQYSYLKDTNSTEYYDGAAWIAAPIGDITGVTAGTGISGGGTSGTVTITNDMATTITAAGDIVVGTGSGTYDNLPIGTTAQVLTADTTVSPYKVKWATPASGSTFVGARLSRTTSLSVPTATYTAVNWDTEVFDTDAFHSTSTNTSRITIPSGKGGKYLFISRIMFPTGTAGGQDVSLYKNGTEYSYNTLPPNSAANTTVHIETIVEAVATDYFEIFVFQNSGVSRTVIVQFVSTAEFSCEYLGA